MRTLQLCTMVGSAGTLRGNGSCENSYWRDAAGTLKVCVLEGEVVEVRERAGEHSREEEGKTAERGEGGGMREKEPEMEER